MNTLTHKNFVGSFNYIENDDIFHGKIEGISDLVTFEGDDLKELKSAFIEAVEDYIMLCAEIGKKPQKSYKGSFSIRVSPDLHRRISMYAAQQNMNLNQFVKSTLQHAVESK